MMNKLALLLSLCTALMAVSASATPYVSPRGYSLDVPPGWQMSPGHSYNDVIFKYTRNAAGGTPTFGVKATPLPAAMTLEALKPAIIADYSKRFAHVVIVSQTYSSVGRVRDLDLVSTNVMGGQALRLHQICVMKNGYIYIFSAACLDKTHAKYDPMVAQVLSSVHWKG